MASGKRRVILVAPTGSGKTVIAAEIARLAVERNRHVLFVAHRTELLQQAMAKLRSLGLSTGIVQASEPITLTAPVQVCSIDTLRAQNRRPPADIIIVDEAHRTAAKSYRNLLADYPQAYVVGLTATPARLDGRGLSDSYDALHVAATVPQLVDSGHLVAPLCYAPHRPNLTSITVRAGEYSAKSSAKAMSHLTGDVVETWLKRADRLRTLVFASSVNHSKELRAAFLSAGRPALHVDGKTPRAVRENAWRALAAGQVYAVCNVGVAVEGLDIPELECVVMARPTRSLTVWLQCCGRVMRPAGDAAIILDHAGCTWLHGVPTAHRNWELESTRRNPVECVPPTFMCRQCLFITGQPFRVCPDCGSTHVPKARIVKTIDGELVAVDENGQRLCPKCDDSLVTSAMYGQAHRVVTRCSQCSYFKTTITDQSEDAKRAEWQRLWLRAERSNYNPWRAFIQYKSLLDEEPWPLVTQDQRAKLMAARHKR
jgi:superfamily II DNA or RNA helicase